MHPSIEAAFRSTTKVLFGRELADLQPYSGYLERDVRLLKPQKSCLGSGMVYMAAFRFFDETKNRAIKMEEGDALGKKALSKGEVAKLSLANSAKMLVKIKLYAPESDVGQNICVEECGQHGYSSYCFHGDAFVYSKYCAYSMWPRSSEYAFGTDFLFSSKFCLKCYSSLSLARCFEMSHSVNCSDCYFCHNLENCHECFFCFNAKNLRHAIGNVEYPKDEYAKMKQALLSDIVAKLERDKTLEASIYNIGCIGRKNE